MESVLLSNKNFNVHDTLTCGQTFRFRQFNNGFIVNTLDKCAYVCDQKDGVLLTCKKTDLDYFKHYFDLSRDYEKIENLAKNSGYDILSKCADMGKGIRILNQDKTEMLFSFIISQNNNIPRIKGIIERLCVSLGEKKKFLDIEYYTFPTIESLASKDLSFYNSLGLGYRANYIYRLANQIKEGLNVEDFSILDSENLKKRLLEIYGVGPKVADCVMLFGFHKSDCFPVDTWIEKIYREDFLGKLTDRNKISQWFCRQFKENSGYFQQYLFYYKRSLEKMAFAK